MVNAVLAPTLAQEFGLTAGMLGLLSSVYFLAVGLFQVPLGLLLDRYGPRRVNAALLVVAAAGGLWFAQADSALTAIAARALIGVGVSACLMASLTAFVLWYPPERLSTMNGIAFSAGAVGAISVTLPLDLLLRLWDWRNAFLVLVGVNVLACAALWACVPERSAGRSGATLAEQLRGAVALLRDPPFRRLAFALGASQFAAVALQTLWIAPWLRDVAGYSSAQVARGLLVVNLGMIAGYLGFGKAAELLEQRGRGAFGLLAAGVATSAGALGLIVFDVGAGLVLWVVFVAAGTAVMLTFSILARRYPKAMAGRASTTINIIGFAGMFLGQWGFGVVLDLWPPTATGYAREAYPWALGALWAVQLAGLAWLLAGLKKL